MERVLLIEGHRVLRDQLQNLLGGNRGWTIHAADPIEGVLQAVAQRPEVVILDTTWNEVNGFWLARLLRNLLPLGKIILLLDDHHPEYENAARANGADAFVAKLTLRSELLPLLAQSKVNQSDDLLTSSELSQNWKGE